MNMEPVYVLALCVLVSLCSATSPPPPPKLTPLNCNETKLQTNIAADLINEHRDEGFVLRPLRINSAYQRESLKVRDGYIYYIDFLVMETDCSVLSGKKWKDCSDKPFYEQAIGDCKAVVLISRPWRVLKLLKYNCTVTPVPSRVVHRTCPDCPALISNITPEIKAKADRLVEKFNKESNQTSYFKVDHVERVLSQWTRGPSLSFHFTIKETGCSKAQADVNLETCNDLKDNETHVGYCKGRIYTMSDNVETVEVSCEIYEPRDDDDNDEHCDHGKEKSDQGMEKPDAKGPGKAGPDHHAHGEHGPERKGHKHHHCRPHHHKHGRHHHPHHHHHHDHPHDHHKHHGNDNRTAAEGHSSSSEEHINRKSFVKKTKESFRIYYKADDSQNAPSPTVPRPPHLAGPHITPLHDKTEFPDEVSPLKTCPGELLMELSPILKELIFV
ncbi:histidine-rich glycoprotein-like [Pseudophryne corroboree]|uniref:histidine-rich glycoprotein-like n=1 Tax=Pseudophryne corroboree TaxID=495146 RepID=UPI0030818B3E